MRKKLTKEQMVKRYKQALKELMDNNVQIRFMGHLEMAPEATRNIILSAVERTKNNTGLILCFAFIYGSKSEMMQAIRHICEDYKNNELSMDEITEELFDSYLMSADLPEVDLMVRTSGECRLSNFMLWQLAYSELYFTEVAWPDFDEEALYDAILAYQHRDRRYGGLK